MSATAGLFGTYGGRYVPETLIPALDELDAAWDAAYADPAFQAELLDMLKNYVGRPSALSTAPRLTVPTITEPFPTPRAASATTAAAMCRKR